MRNSEEVDNAVMQSYPSPTANGQDADESFYQAAGRDEDRLQHDGDSSQLEEPTTHQQHLRTAQISAAELQLAAQVSLAHGLPMAIDTDDHASLQHAADQHETGQHDLEPEHQGDHLPHVDVQSQRQHLEPLQDHKQQEQQESELQELREPGHDLSQHEQQPQSQSQQPVSEPPPMHQDQHDQALQNNHPDGRHEYQPHPSAPFPNAERYEGSQVIAQHQQVQQSHLQPPPASGTAHLQRAFPPQHQQQQQFENVPPRKRSKVSRACDECRRKKVKCDAPSETGEEPCSNCRRSSIRCLFSRVPQKRGPSKGYIKELADRINSIEGKLASEGGNLEGLTDLLVNARSDDLTRKRPLSSITGDFGTPPGSRPVQPFQTLSERSKPYTAASLAPGSIMPAQYQELTTRPDVVMDDAGLDLNHVGQAREVDEGVFETYLHILQPYLPVLAQKKEILDAQLARCPLLLREAFIETLYGAIQSFPAFGGPYVPGDLANASRLVTEWEADTTERTFVMNLLHLQTLIFTAISTDNYGAPSLTGEHGGASKSSILGRAVGLAYSLRLHVSQSHTADTGSGHLELETDRTVATRCWWSLVILDRLNAISTATPLFIPNESVVILPRLQALLGTSGFHVARLSNILARFSAVSLAPPDTMVMEGGAVAVVASFADLSMELFRELLPEDITPATHPIVHLHYWHCRLLASMTSPKPRPNTLLWASGEIVSLLKANAQLISPFNHHFFALVCSALLVMVKMDSVGEEARRLCRELLESNVAPSTWDATIRDKVAEQIRPATAAEGAMDATTSQSLQDLADLATAAEPESTKVDKAAPDAAADANLDAIRLLQTGYLNTIAQA